MKFLLAATLLFSLFFISCNDDDCYQPSEKIIFEFVNSKNENLIENGSINVSTISITRILDENSSVGITGNKIENNKVILHEAISRFDGSANFLFTTNLKLFKFNITSSKMKDCNGYTIKSINFDNLNTSKSENTYKIVLD
ncbi:hypothetical protein [Algoriella sp.]|uniref:hypothetical protein n=1 Tax=Algoriella sp. TaxID=1872434 RepID=UPI001B039DBA|nr:hypothetical protein [Algoriella sp.]MBO6213138.1 hypothetical protein [Algoriella sp.]